MIWKPRWLVKALSWKAISLAWGAIVVHWLTGEFKFSWQYLLWYGVPSLIAFVLHEKLYHMWKVHKRKPFDYFQRFHDCDYRQTERR
jgi:uncharacterized membrane protein